MKKLLILCLTMLLLLAGCSNTASNEDEANLLSLDDDIYYIVKDSIDDLSTNFKLEEGQSLSIEGDYDLNTNGRYTVKFVVRDANDEIVSESEKTIVIDEESNLETIKTEDDKNKDANQSVANNQPTDDTTINDGDTTVSDNTGTGTSDNTNSSSNGNGSTNNSGSNTSNSGLDTSNWMIQAAYDLEGTSGGCEYVASLYLNNIGMPPEAGELQEISSPFTGALVKYYDDNWNYKHTAVYLANNMCLHGNYSSDGTAKVASCELYSHRVYYDPQTVVETVDSGSSDDAWVDGKSPAADYYEDDADGYTPEMCAVPISQLDDNPSLGFWCMDYHMDLIIME